MSGQAPKVIEPRICPECREPFTPIPRKNHTLPEACRGCIRRYNGKRLSPPGVLPAAFREAIRLRTLKRRVRVEVAARKEFGRLTDREIQIFNYAEKIGYDRGYSTAYHLRHGPTPPTARKVPA